MTFVSTCFMMSSLFNQYEDTFLLQSPKGVSCVVPEQYEVLNSSLCTYTLSRNMTQFKCNRWRVHLIWFIWIKKTWIIFCDQKTKLLSATIICRLGSVFGYIIFGLLSDSFGRRKAIIINVIFELAFRLTLIFCDSENWFRLVVFLKSLLGSAHFCIALVLVCEVASNSWRSALNAIVSSPRLLATVCLVPVTNGGPNLETFNLIAFVFDACLLLLLRWTSESPQWLLYNRKISEAEIILFKAAKRNGIELCSNFKIRPVNQKAYNCLDRTWTCVEILTTYNIRVVVVTVMLFWSLYFFQWSCLYVRAYRAGQNYILLKVFSFLILFGTISVFLSRKVKLKQLLLIYIILTGTFNATFIVMISLQFSDTMRSIMSSLGLASGLMGHALILIITPRLFATNVRATLFGCCNATGQLGAITSYLIILFRVMDDLTLMIVEIIVMFILAASCYVIPDPDWRELPDVIEDMDYFSELSKPLRWASQRTNSPSKEEEEMRVYSFGSAVHNFSTRSHSEERPPARPIGFIRLWCFLRNICFKI